MPRPIHYQTLDLMGSRYFSAIGGIAIRPWKMQMTASQGSLCCNQGAPFPATFKTCMWSGDVLVDARPACRLALGAIYACTCLANAASNPQLQLLQV